MRRSSRSRTIPGFVALALFLALGCTSAASSVAPSALASCEKTAPVHVVVGITTWQGSNARVAGALRTVVGQLLRLVQQPGSPGLAMNAYPLSERSFGNEALRLKTACLPLPPEKPDIKTTPTFKKSSALATYNKEVDRLRRARAKAGGDLATFGKQLEQRHWPADPPSIWGFLGLAAREFATVGPARRYVLVFARDESDEERHYTARTYSRGCCALQGATVVFLTFDRESPEDQRRRAWEWSCWLWEEGAGQTLLYRSNDLIPDLFGPEPPRAPWRAEDFVGKGCHR
ncbi:MAG: hypothetical protein HY690_16915 [Chloroflexi bacterium]|nr:hypothetical protein [Chloroflexota bacterium]